MTIGQEGQFTLDLPPAPARLRRADFILTDANRGDLATIDAWRESGEFALAICGAPSAGKTHLASILAGEMDGDHVAVAEDGGIDVVMGERLFVVDELERLSRPGLLLEAMERARNSKGRIVLVGRGRPTDWAGGLRDLETRLDATPRVDVSPPDEELLQAVILKLFADRQLSVPDRVAAYAAPRLRRRLSAANAFVAAMDKASIAAQAPAGVPLARTVLAGLSEFT